MRSVSTVLEVGEVAGQLADRLTPVNIATAVHRCAVLRVRPSARLLARSHEVAESCGPREVSNVVCKDTNE